VCRKNYDTVDGVGRIATQPINKQEKNKCSPKGGSSGLAGIPSNKRESTIYMASKLFVGSLPYSVTDDQLSELFAQAGTVVSARVIMDRDTNRSKGFGFVEMSSDEEAQAAVKALDGHDMDGRRIVVSEARPQERRSGGFGGGDRGGNRGGGNGGGDRRW
jgi:RNA recognition motif-containing protein